MQGAVQYAVVKPVNYDTIKHKMKRTASLHVCYSGIISLTSLQTSHKDT